MHMRAYLTSAIAGHHLREIHKADRLNFKIVPNRHQATNKDRIIQTNKVWYERDWFWGVFQVIDMSAQFSLRRCYFINARISKLESNCDEANRQHLLNNVRYHS